MEEHGSERRQYQRIRKHFILTYFDQANPKEKFGASQLMNISLGGMCLITSKAFPKDACLAIELKTPFLVNLTHMEGIVLESKEKIKGVIFETRLEFTYLNDEAKFVLNKIIEHFEKEESENHE